ncbi:cell number regulator 10-like [Xiphophorus maculatus]|uniref:Cell number regulator 10-like n=1 Tax=Xiphophorus maculatus TaxID=8083 RepID=M3ZJ69_XIPMA|nr:cell number regulator 10-like [Xiphophorus maculatus]XP_023194869.1 cell number regulator 10-like [Xiphophorus maculatus]
MTETPLKEWKSGLFDCFEDVSTCCYGFWCCPFLTCTVSRRFGEQTCLPVCDMLTSATVLMCGVPVIIPPVTLSLRASIRNKRGLKGSLCNDILISCCCIWCSWCQMHRELKEGTPLVIVAQQPQTLQPPTVINVQANPIMMVNQNSAPPPGGFQNPAQGPVGFQNSPQNPGGFQNPPSYPGGFQNLPSYPGGFQNLPPNPGGFQKPL